MPDKDISLISQDQLQDGEKKAFEVEGTHILLCKVGGKFYAVGAKCTHYGAPLAEGALSNDRIVCPWHHAAFDFKTGNLLEHPALDCLPSFKVRVENDEIIVTVPEGAESSRRCPSMVSHKMDKDDRCFLIIGGGAAANAAAQALREFGYQGRIAMLTREHHLPYDRPELSKGYLSGESKEEWLPLRPKEFYKEHEIEILSGRDVIGINTESRMVSLASPESLSFDALLIASGSVPRKLNVPGSDLNSIFTLRSRADITAIIEAAKNSSTVAIIGASFIALETAASLRERGLDVTVIAPEKVPFERIFGEQIGVFFKELHEENGVKFKFEKQVESFEGKEKIEEVKLGGGESVKADFVIIGIGVKPATSFKTDIVLNDDGGIDVDEYFQVKDRIFAAGDVACFPYWYDGSRIRIEHWRTAEQQGRIAAQNMLGMKVAYRSIPFFWTKQYNVSLRYVGNARNWHDIIVDSDLSSKSFIAYYLRDGKVLAAAGVNRDTEMAVIEELMRKNKLPKVDDLPMAKEKMASLARGQ